MRKLLMIAAFAAFAACAKQSDTDVGETSPQTDEATTDQTTTDETTTTTPPAETTPPVDESTTTPPSTGYEPQPSTADTLQTPPGDSAAVERTIPDTSAVTAPSTGGMDTSTTSTGTWGDTSATTTPPITAPDSL